MNDLKLQKVSLGPDWIDLSYGEPALITKSLFKNLNIIGDPIKMPSFLDIFNWPYQPASGKPDLVAVLEQKYKTRVVVTNGAKQALAAAMYACRQAGANSIYYDTPYYPANPSIASSLGLTMGSITDADCQLITSPNNPDGMNLSNEQLLSLQDGRPMIHDGAYYTEIYLPEEQKPTSIGDIQIYSASKMYGLSGLRIGYALVHNDKFYQDVVDFVELTTAGVSTASQDIMRNIEIYLHNNPQVYSKFVQDARASITNSRRLLKNIDPEVLTLVESDSNSMFGWFKIGSKLDSEAAKVYILPGDLFGYPGFMRMNIAQPESVIIEAIERLNKFKKQ